MQGSVHHRGKTPTPNYMPTRKKKAPTRRSATKSRASSRNSSASAERSLSATRIQTPSENKTNVDQQLRRQIDALRTAIQSVYTNCGVLHAGESQRKKCREDIVKRAVEYFAQLKDEAATMSELQHKLDKGRPLTAEEARTMHALKGKCAAMVDSTAELKDAETKLRAASQLQHTLSQFAQKSAEAPTKEQATVLTQTRHDLRSTLTQAKQVLLSFLQREWVMHTLLATTLAGVIGWMAHRSFVKTAEVSTALLHEAAGLSRTIESLTDMVEVASKEGAKWTAAGLGGAVGAANGLLFSSMLSKSAPMGSTAASMLTTAAMGALAGLRTWHGLM